MTMSVTTFITVGNKRNKIPRFHKRHDHHIRNIQTMNT